MKFTGQWDKIFNGLENPINQKSISLIVANTKPAHESARNVYQEDKEEIELAAKNNGFKCIARGRQIHFLKYVD